jgi:hypothetical protein
MAPATQPSPVAPAPAHQRAFWAAYLGLVAVNLALVWLAPVFPGQDLPQHLSYARIMRDYFRADLPFGSYYELPAHFQTYYVSYYLLKGLGSIVSIDAAFRVLFSLYALAVFASFLALIRALHGARRGGALPWTAFLATLVVWSPVTFMGFLEFLLAIPAFLLCCTFLVRCSRRPVAKGDVVGLLLSSLVLGSLHAAAAGFFVLFAALYGLASPTWQRAEVALHAAGAALGTQFLWSALGESGVFVSRTRFELARSVRNSLHFAFVDDLFRLSWNSPSTKLSYLSYHLLGPFTFRGQLVMAAALAGLIVACRRSVASLPPSSTPERRAFGRAVAIFALLAWLAPFGLYVPSELTFVDLRMFTLAFAVGLAWLDPRLFQGAWPRRSLVFACGVFLGYLGSATAGLAREAADVLALVRRVPSGVLMTLTFHHRSAQFAAQFRMTHFLPMYYTAWQGGIGTQFWARYVEHLPIGYRPGKRPAQTADWSSDKFKPADLADARYIVIQRATPDDPDDALQASRRVYTELTRYATVEECRGLWCLLEKRPAPPPP